jgi:hypothetical protein
VSNSVWPDTEVLGAFVRKSILRHVIHTTGAILPATDDNENSNVAIRL